jgi:prolyl-tRNA synthetase
MPDGKALQAGTSHDLGQNFAKVFDWSVQGSEGEDLLPWQNSWGLSTRSIGGLIMAHGDDNGLVFPPRIAPIQVVVVPIYSSENKDKILEFAEKVKSHLSDLRIQIDSREGETAGYKFNKWELKGVPLRIEIGQKEAEKNEITLVRRDNGEKSTLPISKIGKDIPKILEEIQSTLLERHRQFTEENTRLVDSYDEFIETMKGKKGFIMAFWCEDKKCEDAIKSETKATTRCRLLDQKQEEGRCIYCNRPAKYRWVFAQSY